VRSLTYPPKPRPGARVAVLSPSFGAPARYPHVYELGLRRLRDELGVEPVEYPTTRAANATAAERARDVMAAFADPDIGAVLATIGGEDQITLLRHLDPEVLRASPKPFFGYSDNTNLLNHLWRHGVVGYHGGSVMVHLARPGGVHPLHLESLRAALFGCDEYVLPATDEFSDEERHWDEVTGAEAPVPPRPATPWSWHRAGRVVSGPSWGGNLEILSWLLMADRDVLPVGGYAGCVLLLETSEELPSDVEVYRVLRNMGERGLLAQFAAVLVGRAKAWSLSRRSTLDERERYAGRQRAAVLRALDEYAPQAVVVFDLDIGHTDPQLVVPYGGTVTVDGPARRVTVRY
jgi:muramoyltetrapeptide carboxypeptidase LdcA involved in peptidoglycan recycling